MNNITSTNIHSFCRACLSELQKYGSTLTMDSKYNVHESQELSQWIIHCLPVPPSKKNDCLPKFVCSECYQKLHGFYEFRAMTTRSMRTLTEILGLVENQEEDKDWLEIPNEDEVKQSITSTFERTKESDTEYQDVDDKNLVMRTIMESGQFEKEFNIGEQKLPFDARNFVDATIPEESISNIEVLEDAVDTLDISTKKTTKKQLKNRPQPITSKYKCKECKRSYANQENLDAHMRTHQGLRPFQCKKCDSSFNRAYHLRRHMEGVHSECVQKRDTRQKVASGGYNDDDDDDDGDDEDGAEDDKDYKIDDYDDSDVSNYPEDFQAANPKKGTKTKRTPKKTAPRKKKSSATSTTDATKKKFIYQCEECNRFYASEETRAAHMRTHQGLRPFPCTKCPKSFKRAYHLQIHMISAHTEKVEAIVCKVDGCGKSFRLDITYRKHYRLKHTDTPPVMKTYICEDCGRVLRSATALREHRYTHGPREEYPYHCEQCDKRYSSQRHFKEHLIRHTGVKRFVCPYCGMRKTTRNELKTHINYHTKEKQWKCPLCPSVFNSPSNLRRHNSNVHIGLRAHVCRFCNEGFGKIDTLRHHEMRHTGEKPHECHICQKRFIQLVALKTHMKTHAKYGITPEIPEQPRKRQRQYLLQAAQQQQQQQQQAEVQQPQQLQPQHIQPQEQLQQIQQ